MEPEIMPLDIKIDDAEARSALERLRGCFRKGGLLNIIGERVADWGKDRISSGAEVGPDGEKWESLAASTLARKKKKGKGHMGSSPQARSA